MFAESTNPVDYMSPLWTVMIVLLVLAVVAYLVARPLHKYLTDKKTEKIISEARLDADEPEKEKEKEEEKKEG
jgi:F0F1-type ATP synthase membrane subunit b/b'